MKSRKVLFYTFLSLAVAVNILIIVESCVGGVGSASQSQGFTQTLIDIIETINPNSSIGENPEQVHAVVRKLVGHFMLFGLSGIFSYLTICFAKSTQEGRLLRNSIIVASSGLFVAILTETIQYFIPGRVGLITDALIDFAGFTFFAALVFLIYILIYKKKKKVSLAQ